MNNLIYLFTILIFSRAVSATIPYEQIVFDGVDSLNIWVRITKEDEALLSSRELRTKAELTFRTAGVPLKATRWYPRLVIGVLAMVITSGKKREVRQGLLDYVVTIAEEVANMYLASQQKALRD